MVNAAEQYVDPAVSRAKFESEITDYLLSRLTTGPEAGSW